MADIFLHLVNISIAASWLILAIIVYRIIFRKAPKWVMTILWCFVGLRLICPITFESRWSLIPSEHTIVRQRDNIVIDSGFVGVDSTINAYLEGAKHDAVNADQIQPATIITVIWMVGVIVLLTYSIISYVSLKRRVYDAVKHSDRVYQSERIDSPFILGIVRPVIYMSYGLEDEQIECVLRHERAHIKRGDHLIKPLGFLLLCIYWFNPFVIVAYILLCHDIELACDERVICEIGFDKKQMYSQTLLDCSIPRKLIIACPVAFAEVGVKERVQNIMNMKKTKVGILIIAIIGIVVISVMFMTKPFEKPVENNQNVVANSNTVEEKKLEEDKASVADIEEQKQKDLQEVVNEQKKEINAEVEKANELAKRDGVTVDVTDTGVNVQVEQDDIYAEQITHPLKGTYATTRLFDDEHQAVDFVAEQGASLYAAISGKVIAVDFDEENGNYFVIEGLTGMTVYYNHCDSVKVKVGDSVNAGDEVATLGNTGRSTGPHLHFAIADADGNFVDVESLME